MHLCWAVATAKHKCFLITNKTKANQQQMPRAGFSKPTDQCPRLSHEEEKGKRVNGGETASPGSLADEGLWALPVCIFRNP